MLEYLYTLDLPTLASASAAKVAFVLGDKYNLPKLRHEALVMLFHMVDMVDDTWPQHLDHVDFDIALIEEIWTWTYADIGKLKKEILKVLCKTASVVIRDEKFQSLLSRNKSFAMDFIRALADNQRKDEARSDSRS